jgi:hypothetical protein
VEERGHNLIRDRPTNRTFPWKILLEEIPAVTEHTAGCYDLIKLQHCREPEDMFITAYFRSLVRWRGHVIEPNRKFKVQNLN